MQLSSLVYIIREDRWLMLYRNKKKHDVNAGKWIGVGGKMEDGESLRECAYREIAEETGMSGGTLQYAGMLYFHYSGEEDEKICVYLGYDFAGEPGECTEGTLAWINREDILSLQLWEGDRIFLKRLLEGDLSPFCLDLCYDGQGNLLHWQQRDAEPEKV
ncbi:MAG: 8-oxo-dGTP diphosphatase [Solobacterium sp.]|nr:8-oxo-dGTP diphosphatase [Solobacterium sp.]